MPTLLQRVRRWTWRDSSQPVVLMYHRVARPPVDPWGLAVSPTRFEEHLSVLRRRRQTMPLSDFVHRLVAGTLPATAAAVTFDDGYADNCLEARPRLDAAGIPATVFLTTGALDGTTEFWWDELARGLLLRKAAIDCEIEIAGERVALTCGPETDFAHERQWRAWNEPETPRERLYFRVWERLRAAPARARSEVLCRLRRILEFPAPEPGDLPLTGSQVRALAADPLFEFGGHTVTHPVLPALDPAARRHEVLGGRIACEELVGRPVEGFAYPHGAHDPASRETVAACGFRWACSTESRAVAGRGDHLFALPRIQALDWDGDGFDRALLETRP
jgi:peptidoglycan/xylan/chitin deacetylase (PgdA/CDA1 family)